MPSLPTALLALALAAAAPGAPDPAPGAAPAPVRPDAARARARADLREALLRITASPALSTARTAVLVRSLDTGEEVFALDADVLLNPASNVKLFTSAAALAVLGPEYRFETEILLGAAGASGGPVPLHVRGKGDPTLVNERLWALAGEIAHLGVTRVGDLVLDESWFDGEREGPGFDQERGDRAYLAPTGALSLDFNAVAVHVAPGGAVGSPGRVSVEPASDFLQVVNRTTTTLPRSRRRISVSSEPAGGRQRITVEGRLPLGGRDQVVHRKVDDPALFLGLTLKRDLELRGVKVAGKVRLGPVPPGARLLYVAESESLGEVVRRLNKHSNNFMAEQILKALGAETHGPPGSWPKGIAAVEEFLARAGLPRGTYLMKNGSGLNDANRFSARQTVTLLEEMWRRFPVAAEFVAALPVAGRDGTIRWRMEGTPAAGRLRAKTGTLEGVTSLSGYAESQDGERLVFAVLVNDHAGRGGGAVRGVDALGSAIASAGARAAPEAVAAGTGGGPDGASATGTRVAAYYRLALAADPRNLPFLRTALRTEDDPVARMAAAEAVYLSDPYGDAARRVFLEAVPPDPAALARLQALAGAAFSSPVVISLGDLAAEGVPEALLRLAELCAAGMAEELAPVWEEVAAVAPEETLALLRVAPAPLAEAALASLARGIARSAAEAGPSAPRHPCLAALEVAGHVEGPSGEEARALRIRLDERLAEARGAARDAAAGPTATPATGAIGPAAGPASGPAPAPGGG